MTNTKSVNKNFKVLLLGIVAIVMVTMSLFHVVFNRYSEEQLTHKKTLKEIKIKREKVNHNLISSFSEKVNKNYPKDKQLQILVEKFKNDYNLNQKTIREDIIKYNQTKTKLAQEQSFLGRGSFKFWLFQFGLVMLALYFVVQSLINDFKKTTKTGHEVISVIGLAVCLFWMYHLLFKTQNDFYIQTYIVFDLVICAAAAYALSRLLKYYATKQGLIKTLIELIVRIKQDHYKKIYVKALYAETHNEALTSTDCLMKQGAAFDKDIAETIKKANL